MPQHSSVDTGLYEPEAQAAGYGKSLVYQVLPACAKEILQRTQGQLRDNAFCLLVLSPLLSLMQDQAERLLSIHISSTFLSSEIVE